MLDLLRQKIAEAGADALLITQPANVRYLSGFSTPADGRVLISPAKAMLLTDGRYIAQAKAESRLEVDIFMGERMERVVELAKAYKLAIEADHLTLAQFEELSQKLPHKPIATRDLVSDFRRIKTPQELALIRAAAQMTDAAFGHILGVIKVGMTEVDVALELEAFMRRQGAERKAFDITVASGLRSAMPHGTASPKQLQKGELVTLDYGAVVEGYHSDLTRTIALGEISDKAKAIYEAVLETQQTALAALAPEKDGKAIDALARESLKKYGLEGYFSHGLGHGVGLDIHEGPRLSFTKSDTLKPNMVVTVEPGVYIPGELGVRIEDLAVITDAGYELLSKSDKQLIEI
jgi:Xaa-Pro aminopeptidase